MKASRYSPCQPDALPLRSEEGAPLIDRIAGAAVTAPVCGRCGVEYRWHDHVDVRDLPPTGQYMVYLYEPRCRCWTMGTREGVRGWGT